MHWLTLFVIIIGSSLKDKTSVVFLIVCVCVYIKLYNVKYCKLSNYISIKEKLIPYNVLYPPHKYGSRPIEWSVMIVLYHRLGWLSVFIRSTDLTGGIFYWQSLRKFAWSF